MRYEIDIHIDAEPEAVWEVLSDVEHWPEWTRSMISVQRLEPGSFGAGSAVKIQQPKLSQAIYTVTEYEPGRSFTWTAKAPGVRTLASHHVAPDVEDDHTTVHLAVHQSGLLAPLVGLLAAGLIRRYMTMEAEGLKNRCESGG